MTNPPTATRPITPENCRYYMTYTGIQLPLKLVNELEPGAISNRNTYFLAEYDDAGRVTLCQKVVYGEIELEHRYHYHDNGNLKRAEILNAENETHVMQYTEQGRMIAI
ncbi:hypothetical protein A9404_01430 [Halothiobacillus diazotrophicus]|uniref:Sugar-binding protein n=1 Tax=Halothiobacillus diazotrophicus TaxID=1860122 RepID=A0A191ZEB8_9GAMM|nr:DUF6156 family protein [Halothiobacillus diazotrophicus]ANJ66212.1 hypothetical protein A9404_01430 [Halothiobacillus diazotrophicus]